MEDPPSEDFTSQHNSDMTENSNAVDKYISEQGNRMTVEQLAQKIQEEMIQNRYTSKQAVSKNSYTSSFETNLSSTQELVDIENQAPCFGIRHLMVFLLFFANLVGFSLRVGMSIAIVPMVVDPDLCWKPHQKSNILSSFFWGYLITQIPSGMINQKLGAKWVLGFGLLVNAICTLFTPLAAHNSGYGAVIALRVIMGLTQATLLPSTHAVISKWTPITERSRMASFSFAGGQVGTIIGLAAGGPIADAWGWEYIFYFLGTLCLIWCLCWFILSSNSPAQHRCISKEELKFIEATVQQDVVEEKYPIPWFGILTSVPVYAVTLGHMSQNWGFYTLMTELPTYMQDVLEFELSANGLLSAIPYLMMSILSFVFGSVADRLVKRGIISLGTSRKLFNTIGFWGPAIFLIAFSYVPEGRRAMSVGLLSVAVGLNGAVYSGFQVNHIDLSPRFASVLMGITNSMATVISLLVPLVVEIINTETGNRHQWSIIFWIAASIYLVGNLIFLIFGSTARQSWDEPKKQKRKVDVEEYKI